MEKRKNRQALNIKFHNPNSVEVTMKFLTEIIAQELSEQYIYKLTNKPLSITASGVNT